MKKNVFLKAGILLLSLLLLPGLSGCGAISSLMATPTPTMTPTPNPVQGRVVERVMIGIRSVGDSIEPVLGVIVEAEDGSRYTALWDARVQSMAFGDNTFDDRVLGLTVIVRPSHDSETWEIVEIVGRNTPLLPPSTPSPETQLDITTLLLQQGDFPPALSPGAIIDPPRMFRDVPPTDRAYYQQFIIGGDPAGGVAVFIYGDVSRVGEAYSVILSGMGDTEPLYDVGEQARIAVTEDLIGVDLIFVRCSAVIHIRVAEIPNMVDAIRSYAKRLDTRLTGVVCQSTR